MSKKKKGKIKLVQIKKSSTQRGIVCKAAHGPKAVWIQHAITKYSHVRKCYIFSTMEVIN